MFIYKRGLHSMLTNEIEYLPFTILREKEKKGINIVR